MGLKTFEIQINESLIQVQSTNWMGALHKALNLLKINKKDLEEELNIYVKVVENGDL